MYRSLFSAALALLVAMSTPAASAELTVLRIGTGGTGGTYFPIGSLIAQSVSERRGDGARGGVPSLLAVAQISSGSVANAEALSAGHLQGALMQSDVAYWAYHGIAVFEDRAPMRDLRVLAHLYPESLHLVARLGSGIESVADLEGKRVSMDEPGSGTVLDARFILEYHDLSESDLHAFYLKPHFAVDALARGELDAFFIFAGYPVSAIERLAGSSGASLVPIQGPAVERILKAHPYFSRGVIPDGTYGQGIIPAGTYRGVADTPTLTVGAQLMVHADLDEDLVYAITRELWGARTRAMLDQGHPKGPEIQLQRALLGVSLPLHPGAARFYTEQGIALPGGGKP
jgi:TRAP transporter TAXI family solute receptor